MKSGLFRLQYEVEPRYTETGSDHGAKLSTNDLTDDEVRAFLADTASMGYKETLKYVQQHQPNSTGGVVAVPFTTRTPEALAFRLDGLSPKLIYLSRPLHTVEKLDDMLAVVNRALTNNGIFCCHAMTSSLKRQLIAHHYPWGVRHIIMSLDYLWHSVFPKLRLTRQFYFVITQGKNRTMSRVEIIGRLFRAGFDVIDEQFREGEFFIIGRKISDPVDDTPPIGSPIIHLRRVGLNGKEIVVHKFRTMYNYSEYVQPYVYHYQSLERGGKFKDDYRVNFWGHLLRRVWLDELPMVWNLLRGDLKLVGVRPLSHQYFSLYTPELQALRIKTKPGLLPPFYYEAHTPETLDEVQESERRYLEAYLKKPFATDWRYFWGIVGNILLRRKRSK